LTGLGIDEFLTRTDVVAGTTSHFLPDGLGSTIALTDAAGTVQTEHTYEPFGRTTAPISITTELGTINLHWSASSARTPFSIKEIHISHIF